MGTAVGGSFLGPSCGVARRHSREWPRRSSALLGSGAVLILRYEFASEGSATLRQTKSPKVFFVTEVQQGHSCEHDSSNPVMEIEVYHNTPH